MAKKIKLENCPKCAGTVEVAASRTGRFLKELVSYRARCDNCGMFEERFGDEGTLRAAKREFNRWARKIRLNSEPHQSGAIEK